jgi:hypothetical protein
MFDLTGTVAAVTGGNEGIETGSRPKIRRAAELALVEIKVYVAF